MLLAKFFREFLVIFLEVSAVEISDKIVAIKNEMTLYRFDVMINIDHSKTNVSEYRTKFQYATLSPDWNEKDLLEDKE